jgi:hypothetical protein
MHGTSCMHYGGWQGGEARTHQDAICGVLGQ